MLPQSSVIISNPKCASYLVGISASSKRDTKHLVGHKIHLCTNCFSTLQKGKRSIWRTATCFIYYQYNPPSHRRAGDGWKNFGVFPFNVPFQRCFSSTRKCSPQPKRCDQLGFSERRTKNGANGNQADRAYLYKRHSMSAFQKICLVSSTGPTEKQSDEHNRRRRDHRLFDENLGGQLPFCDRKSSSFVSSNGFHSNYDETNGHHTATEESSNVNLEVLSYYFADLSPKLHYLSPSDRARILAALEMAYEAHKGQFRKSGEPFIIHPIAVAAILADLKVDRDTVISGLLHDTVEDTPVTFELIERMFGKDVRRIVEGETKLSKLTSSIGASLDKGRKSSVKEFSSSELDRGSSQTTIRNSLFRSSNDDKQCEYLKQIFIAMTEDVRVILVKLADRLHNMRTLDFMSPEKQRKIAGETLEIFAPLAHRLGLGRIRVELEEISFRFYYPQEYVKFSAELCAFKQNNKVDLVLEQAHVCLKQLLEQDLVLKPLIKRLEIQSGTKSLYTLYKKIQAGASLSSIYGLASITIVIELNQEIVDHWKHEERNSTHRQRDPTAQWNWLEILRTSQKMEEDFAQISTASLYERNVCYHILGNIHSLWKPIPGKMKDYIAFPKPNGYQSLHTVIFFDSNYGSFPLEIQIRTQTMHEIAELGITCRSFLDCNAEGEKSRIDWRRRTVAWLKSLRDYCDEFSHSSIDLIDAIRKDLLGSRIFVFTPKGYILDLPKGSTPIDAAYHIHSDVGHNMLGARVNGRFVRLDHVLQNADVIKIVKGDSTSGPSPDWIHMARSRTARQKIRRYLRQKERNELIQKGKQDLEQICQEMSVTLPSSSEILCGLQRLLHLLKKRITLRTTTSSNYSISFVQWLESLKSCDEFYISVAKIAQGSRGELRMDWLRLILRFLHIRSGTTTTDQENSHGVHVISKDQVVTSTATQQPLRRARQRKPMNTPNFFASRCCLPVFGDEIVGIFVNCDTVMVHRSNCTSTSSSDDSFQRFHLSWKNLPDCLHRNAEGANSNFKSEVLLPTRLLIKAKGTVGLLSSVAGVISEHGFSITRSASSCEAGREVATLFFEILVGHVNDVAAITTLLGSCAHVFEVQRVGDVPCLDWCSSKSSQSDKNLCMPPELVELPEEL